ncbi:Lsr2 dimerization domain-containing protein [Actinocrispum wychmicini]|uniref:Lsr2 protein n=1 Tax=Actinocrispum wychmicini TaxID=1213861 RepID=A0A4V2S3B7_9PSEU|nr:histone-like nucleoid-structuring protein Lsr2 [Actinocrispum wychmicini]TCO43750.1 Lsr2 protein [Actinocrispum wychmicini]
MQPSPHNDTPKETVQFALDGVQFAVALTTERATALRDHLKPYIDAARVVDRSARLGLWHEIKRRAHIRGQG